MFTKDILFWNVDTQFDFMNADGKLYAPGAEAIQPILHKITKFASKSNIQVVNTADHHYANSKELSDHPDFVTTFPEHCMADSQGAEYIPETKPALPIYEILWDKTYGLHELQEAAKYRNIVIRKDAFDVFEGNRNADQLLHLLNPKRVFVYGVTTNVCVHCAAVGLAKRNLEVYVLEDAIKELPNIPLPYEEWNTLGIRRIQFAEVSKFMN